MGRRACFGEGKLVVQLVFIYIWVCVCTYICSRSVALVGPMFLNKVLCVYAFVDRDDFDYIYRPN